MIGFVHNSGSLQCQVLGQNENYIKAKVHLWWWTNQQLECLEQAICISTYFAYFTNRIKTKSRHSFKITGKLKNNATSLWSLVKYSLAQRAQY